MRTVTVKQFQAGAMQVGEIDAGGDRDISTYDLVERDHLTGQVVDAAPFSDQERADILSGTLTASPSAVERAADEDAERLRKLGCGAPSATAERLQALNVGASCTAEMSLSMIRARVMEASYRLDAPAPTDQELQDEADRILASFTDNRTGPIERQYDVNPDGTVRDWRRPDPAPQRDPFEPPVHTITDEGVRYSGGGTTDGEAQQQSLFLVPSDAAFAGRLYREAPELANIAERLIADHGFLAGLENCDVRWYWKRKTGVSKGRVKIGFMKRASDLLGHFTGADFIGWLSATTARDGKFTDRQVEAAVFHQLLHIDADEKGNWIFAPHDFEGFAQEVRHYGTWTEDLKLGGTAFVAAHQMGLFSEDDDEDEDESGGPMHAPMRDGAGVLIHADGTPLTDDEIEAMERRELADDDMEAIEPEDDDPENTGGSWALDPLADDEASAAGPLDR